MHLNKCKLYIVTFTPKQLNLHLLSVVFEHHGIYVGFCETTLLLTNMFLSRMIICCKSDAPFFLLCRYVHVIG